MNRKDFYHVNEKDPLRGKTILVICTLNII